VLYEWFTAMRSVGKPINGLMIAEKVKFFLDTMKKLTSAHCLRTGCEI